MCMNENGEYTMCVKQHESSARSLLFPLKFLRVLILKEKEGREGLGCVQVFYVQIILNQNEKAVLIMNDQLGGDGGGFLARIAPFVGACEKEQPTRLERHR